MKDLFNYLIDNRKYDLAIRAAGDDLEKLGDCMMLFSQRPNAVYLKKTEAAIESLIKKNDLRSQGAYIEKSMLSWRILRRKAIEEGNLREAKLAEKESGKKLEVAELETILTCNIKNGDLQRADAAKKELEHAKKKIAQTLTDDELSSIQDTQIKEGRLEDANETARRRGKVLTKGELATILFHCTREGEYWKAERCAAQLGKKLTPETLQAIRDSAIQNNDIEVVILCMSKLDKTKAVT